MSTPVRRLSPILPAAVLQALVAAQSILAQPAPLDEVLERAKLEAQRCQISLSQLVAEERYVQETRGRLLLERRELVSDYLIIWIPQQQCWVGFRDVFEVDGRLVRDRQDRLVQLFLRSDADALPSAKQIAAESARHNIGRAHRDFNVPTWPLRVLHPANFHRFRFESDGEGPVNSVQTMRVKFRELESPTLVRDFQIGKDLFSYGTLWIDPETGQVLKAEILIDHVLIKMRAPIEVRFARDHGLGCHVPTGMSERYNSIGVRQCRDTTEGEATYSKFRRFTVETHEEVAGQTQGSAR
ncbi:MAG: hypothetical protein AB1714_31695 [Acidobacteriota bacterium]